MTATDRTIITDVRIFDGHSLTEPRTVVLEAGVIASICTTAPDGEPVDGRGATLLPGLIDTHVHIDSRADLERCAHWGLTTVLDMAALRLKVIDQLRKQPGLPDLLSAGRPASAPGGLHTAKMGFPAHTAVRGPGDAARFVSDRVTEHSDYIKVIFEDLVPKPATLDVATVCAVIEAAHREKLKVIAHVSSAATLRSAVEAGVDIITHTPLDEEPEAGLGARAVAGGIVLAPTLTMMGAVQHRISRKPSVRLKEACGRPSPTSYDHARSTVEQFHRAGVTIIAGTDANNEPKAPATVPHGESLHGELDLLVEAGLSPVEALRAATNLPANVFGLTDRGAVEPGRRADLILVDGDPTQDISATRKIRSVWIQGTQIR